jgi:hypothetical protein
MLFIGLFCRSHKLEDITYWFFNYFEGS